MFHQHLLIRRHDCGLQNYSGIVVSEIKIKEQHYIPKLTVAFCVTSIFEGCARCDLYRQRATDVPLLASQSLTDLMLFVARRVLQHSGHGLEMASFAKVATRVGVL